MYPYIGYPYGNTPNHQQCGEWQCPVFPPMPKNSRQWIEGDNQPIPRSATQVREAYEGYAVTKGYLNDIELEKIPEFEKQLEEFMDNYHPAVLENIRTSGKLETETENELKTALDELVAQFNLA